MDQTIVEIQGPKETVQRSSENQKPDSTVVPRVCSRGRKLKRPSYLKDYKNMLLKNKGKFDVK